MRMLYCIRERKAAGVLSGVFGCGKTVIGQVILQELSQERYRTAYVANPRLGDLDLLRMIAHQLGLTPPPAGKTDVLIGLETLMTNAAQEGRDTVVVVDEAHTIRDAGVLEELRLLMNFHRQDRFLVTLLLLGQPELTKLIGDNPPFEQRIGIKSHVAALTFEDTRDYIHHRLQVAGHAEPASVFTSDALQVIYDSAGGIPRRLNRLCDICLLAAMGRRQHIVESSVVLEEAKELAV